jgi:hypothetical protein
MIYDLLKKVTDFWSKYEIKIVLILGFILVAVISFEGGYLKGKSLKSDPIVVEKALAEAQNCEYSAITTNTGQMTPNTQNNKKECLYVASKNSNKFHASGCTWAKRIKPENLICFSSKDEAIKAGRQPDATCIK